MKTLYSTRRELLLSSTTLFCACILFAGSCAVSAFGSAEATAEAQAYGGVAVSPASGSDWVLNTGIRFWFVDGKARFGHPAWSPYIGPTSSPLGNKNAIGPVTRTAGPINDPDSSGANGVVKGTVNVTSIGFATIDYNYNLDTTSTAVAGPHNTDTIGRLFDPISYKVGSTGTGIVEHEFLGAGSQFQSPFGPDPLTVPKLTLQGRLGLGDYAQKPAEFWGDTPPLGILDLFNISISQDVNHHVSAAVTFTGTTSDFALSFGMTADELTQAIENASWTFDNGIWTLNQDIPFDVTITSLNQDNFGADFTLGTLVADEAEAEAPEPSTLLLAGSSLLGVTGIVRKRIACSRSN